MMTRKKTSRIETGQKNPLPASSPLSSLSEITAEAEKEHIIKILKKTGGNKTRAAEILGISRKTLWEKSRAYNIE